MTEKEIAQQLSAAQENIVLVYAFNSTGKTRLSVAYKNNSKDKGGNHSGVYYNAYSEDLFIWENDEPNDNENIHLKISRSSLDPFLAKIYDETPIREKLAPYKPKYDFKLIPVKADDPDKGWSSVVFNMEDEPEKQIKISRGEERIFVWCLFLTLFEIEGWSDKQNKHIFIDDPVSSLDDHNIYVTAKLILELFEKHCDTKKIIVTTHHMGLFSILQDWLGKGENATKFKIKKKTEKKVSATLIKESEEEVPKYLIRFLEKNSTGFKLVSKKKGTVLYHLLLLQLLKEAVDKDELNNYHFVLLRQVLESSASFFGEGRFSYVLDKLSFKDVNTKSDIINSLSHEKLYTQKLAIMSEDSKELFKDVFYALTTQIPFSL